MVANILLIFIVLFICYAYTNHNREFNATASAIQEIWSGSCRLSCRNSQYSGLSGLSGLVPAPGVVGHIGATCDCVCNSCPCALVENVLKTCRPATTIYTRSIEFISDCYYDVVKTLTDLYYYLEQVMRNEGSGQRQLISLNKLNSGANINFTNKIKEEVENGKAKVASTLKQSRSITFRRESDTDKFTSNPKTTPRIALNVELSETVVPRRSSEQALETLSNCSRCIEKNMTCIGTCPRAKK